MFIIILTAITGSLALFELILWGKNKKNRIFYGFLVAALYLCLGMNLDDYLITPDTSNVAPELIQSIEKFENTKENGASIYDIEYILARAVDAEMEISDAIHMIDPDITEEEAAAIIKYSDTLQNKKVTN